jgi:phage anti-repressor protein
MEACQEAQKTFDYCLYIEIAKEVAMTGTDRVIR